MLSPEDMFRSYGSIRVLLVEADEGGKMSKTDCFENKFYVSVSLVDDKEAKTISRFSSACYLFSRNPSSINEEFIFDGVASTHYLQISLHTIGDQNAVTCQQTMIPVSRLEEDVEISQWYQMYSSCPSSSSISGRGEIDAQVPGSAIKLQIAYMRVEMVSVPATPSSLEKIELSTESKRFDFADSVDSAFTAPMTLVLPSSKWSPGGSYKEGGFQADFGSELELEYLKYEDSLEATKSVSEKEKMLVSCMKSPSGTRGSISKVRDDVKTTFQDCLIPEADDDADKKESALSRCFSFILDESELEEDDDDDDDEDEEESDRKERKESFREAREGREGREERGQGEGDERLTVGLIDYALLIGPAEDSLNEINVFKENMSFSERENKRVQVQYSLHPENEHEILACSSFGTPPRDRDQLTPRSPMSKSSGSSGRSDGGMESDMCIWDRFPLEDHEESPLPAKIEYFACPDGSKVAKSVTRPDPRFSSFILSGAGELDGQYGVCLTAFIKSHNQTNEGRNNNNNVPNNHVGSSSSGNYSGNSSSGGERNGEWWNQGGDDEDNTADTLPGRNSFTVINGNNRNNGNGNNMNNGGNGNNESNYISTWSSVTLCLLTRWPHVQQLQRCLLYLYRTSVLPSLIQWEGICEISIEEHKQNIINSCHSTDIDDDGENISYLVLKPLQLSSQCVELLTMLCLESPVPIWGIFTLDLVLPATSHISNEQTNDSVDCVDRRSQSKVTSPPPTHPTHSTHPTHPTTTKYNSYLGSPHPEVTSGDIDQPDTVVSFAQSPPEDLPLCPYSLSTSLFRCLGCKGVLTVLTAALAESRILFFSSDASLLPAVCESLRILLYPLKWAHVYLPVVPSPLLDLVQAPVPFILGTLTKWMDLIPVECLRDVMLVDLDTGAIDAMQCNIDQDVNDTVLSFPPKIERWLLCTLQQIMMPNVMDSDSFLLFSKEKNNKKTAADNGNTNKTSRNNDLKSTESFMSIMEKDTAIQLLVFDVMANLLRFVPGCIFSLNIGAQEGPSHHVFNRPLFLFECIEDDCRLFLTQLTDTNAFEQFTESLYSPSMGFFLRALGTLPPPPNTIKVRGSLRILRGHERGASQFGRDVYPLPADEGTTNENNNRYCYTFPDPVIVGGDRLNVVRLPTVSVTVESVTVTAPSSPSPSPESPTIRKNSSSMRGMLVFPASSQQVNRPFSLITPDCSSPQSAGSMSPKGSWSESDGIGISSTFPDWVCSLPWSPDKPEKEKEIGGKGDAKCIQNCALTMAIRIIDFYLPLLICEREKDGHPDHDLSSGIGGGVGHGVGGRAGCGVGAGGGVGCNIPHEGYQPGNVISSKPYRSKAFPVLSLALFSTKCRGSRASSDADVSASSGFSPDSHDWEGIKLPTRSPRLRALRNGSQLERELLQAESTLSTAAVIRARDRRSSTSMLSSSMSWEKAKAKINRTMSTVMTPSTRLGTGGSAKSTSPSYLSFLPLIGKPSALSALSDGRIVTLEDQSDCSSVPPSPPYRDRAPSLTPSLTLSVTEGRVWRSPSSPLPSGLPPADTRGNGIIVRSHSYGRMRSSTFSLVSTRRNSFAKQPTGFRRRHSNESLGLTLALAAVTNNTAPFASNSTPFAVNATKLKIRSMSERKYHDHQESAPKIHDSPQTDSKRSNECEPSPASSVSLEHFQNPNYIEKLELDAQNVSPSFCLCPAVIFDSDAFELSAGRINEWTAGELAIALKQPLKSILKILKREAEAGMDPYSPWPSSSPAPAPESVKSPFNIRSPNRRASNRAIAGIGGAITDYLQFAFSGASMSTRQVEHLERRCASALEAHDNRMRLVHLLRQTNKAWVPSVSLPPSPTAIDAIARQRLRVLEPQIWSKQQVESQLFPLHSSTFELLSKLYSLAVEACVCERDYLAAYGLLGVGGLYFQVQKSQMNTHTHSDKERIRERERGEVVTIDGTEETEFLSERVSQHPIFQSPQLWIAVMRDRLATVSNTSVGTIIYTTPSVRRDSTGRDGILKGISPALDLDSLFFEAYSSLFIINRLGVNFERAAAFNKLIASDYRLLKGQYQQLQQYTEKLYGRAPSPHIDIDEVKAIQRMRSKSLTSSIPNGGLNGSYNGKDNGKDNGRENGIQKGGSEDNGEKGEKRDRNSFPLSSRDDMLVFKNEDIPSDNNTEDDSVYGSHKVYPRDKDKTDERYTVLRDLTLLSLPLPSVSDQLVRASTPSFSFSPLGLVMKPSVMRPLSSHSAPRGYGYAPPINTTPLSTTMNRRSWRGAVIVANGGGGRVGGGGGGGGGGGTGGDANQSPTRQKANAMAQKIKNYFGRRKSDENGSGDSNLNVPALRLSVDMDSIRAHSMDTQHPQSKPTITSMSNMTPMTNMSNMSNMTPMASMTPMSSMISAALKDSTKDTNNNTRENTNDNTNNNTRDGTMDNTKDNTKDSPFSSSALKATTRWSPDKKKEEEYAALSLEGSLSDRVVSLDTMGRYLIAGLRDGGLNVTDLMTGELMTRLNHSSFPAIKQVPLKLKQNQQYGGVTQLQCLPPLSCELSGPLSGPQGVVHGVGMGAGTGSGPGVGSGAGLGGGPGDEGGVGDVGVGNQRNQFIFVSSCTLGIIKLWNLVSIERRGEEEEGEVESVPTVDLLAVIKAHEGEAISCLRAEYSSEKDTRKRVNGKENKEYKEYKDYLSWIVASGDSKGSIVITRGGFQPISLSNIDDTETKNILKLRRKSINLSMDRRSRSMSQDSDTLHQQSVQSTPVTAVIGRGSATCLVFTRVRRSSRAHLFGQSPSQEWEYLAIGTSEGVIALVDVQTAQCKYLLTGHTGCVTSVLSLPSLTHDGSDRSNSLLASCGLDRRVILWTIPIPAPSLSPTPSPSARSQSLTLRRQSEKINSDWRNSSSKKVVFQENSLGGISEKGGSEKEGGVIVLEGNVLLAAGGNTDMYNSNNNNNHSINSSNNSGSSDTQKSSPGPLTALTVSPISTSTPGNGSDMLGSLDKNEKVKCRQSLFLAAASADGTVVLWELYLVPKEVTKEIIKDRNSLNNLSQRSQKSEKFFKSEKSEKFMKSEKSEKIMKAEKSEKWGQSGQSEKGGGVSEKSDRSDRSEGVRHTVVAGPQVVLKGHTDRVTSMLYKASGAIETVSLDGTMRVWMRAPTGDTAVGGGYTGAHNSPAVTAATPYSAMGDGVNQSTQSTSNQSTSVKSDNRDRRSNGHSNNDTLDRLNNTNNTNNVNNSMNNSMKNMNNGYKGPDIIINNHDECEVSYKSPEGHEGQGHTPPRRRTSFIDNNGFICRVVLTVFSADKNNQGGIVLFSTSDCSSGVVITHSSITRSTRRDSTRGSFKGFGFSDYQPKVKSNAAFKAKLEASGDRERRESGERGERGGRGDGGDRGDNGDDEEKGGEGAYSSASRRTSVGRKSWLIAVSIQGTVKAFTTPTFAPPQLSDTQTF